MNPFYLVVYTKLWPHSPECHSHDSSEQIASWWAAASLSCFCWKDSHHNRDRQKNTTEPHNQRWPPHGSSSVSFLQVYFRAHSHVTWSSWLLPLQTRCFTAAFIALPLWTFLTGKHSCHSPSTKFVFFKEKVTHLSHAKKNKKNPLPLPGGSVQVYKTLLLSA